MTTPAPQPAVDAPQAPRTRRAASWEPRVAAAVLLLLGFIPWPALLNVHLELSGLGEQLHDWLTGSVLTIGVGALAYIVSRRMRTVPPIPWQAADLRDSRRVPLLLVALGSLILYAVVSTTVFSRRPLLIDEVAQLWQAQRYAEGHLWLPAPTHREFFSFLHLVDVGDRVYSQFPPGGPFMIWLGVLAGAPWLVGPVSGMLCVLLFARLARAAEPEASARWVLGAVVLFAVTPFAVFMFGSYMNHVTALLWILVAVVALIELTGEQLTPRGARLAALSLGLGLGAAATIRPLDAFAFALPAAVWLMVRAGRSSHRWMENIIAGVGVAIPFAAMMYVNVQTTGHPLRFGYEVLWGATHGLGFHAAPWGEPHTPLRGFALASLYQWRLQSYLFETPFPSLVLPVAALWLTRRIGALDRYLLASSALVVFFYLLYWHNGFYLGPRFVVPLLPALVLWTARVPRLVAQQVNSVHVRRAIGAMLVFGAVGAVVFNLPVRIASYRAGLTSMRVDYGRLIARSGVQNALVFVRESWGAQLVVRLWALGVSRPATESIYRGTDTCKLEQLVTTLERDGVRGLGAERRLFTLLAEDSAYVQLSPLTPDGTEHVRPGTLYPAICQQRIEDDRMGFLHYAPLRLVTNGGNIIARDLQARDSLLLAEYPGRPVFLLTRAGIRVDDPLVFKPLARDSLYAVWRAAR